MLAYAATDGISLSGQLARASGEDAGSYAILQGTVDDAHNPNYRIDFDSSVLFTVEPRPITIYPAAGQSKQYGFADPAVFPYQPLPADALVSGDELSGHLVRDRSAADSEAVGSYAFLWKDAQGQDANYAITVDDGMQFTIERRKITVIPARARRRSTRSRTVLWRTPSAEMGLSAVKGSAARWSASSVRMRELTTSGRAR